jgi:DNA-binding NtrC family response regulator
MKILLVDDSELMRRLISSLLSKRLGWAVSTASSVETAIDAFFKDPPDAVLVDFVLEGGRTGLEILSAILAARPVPSAILTTGALTTPDQQTAERLGARLIQKPVQGREDEFLREVKDVLEKTHV